MGDTETISGRVSIEIADHVAEVRLDRPDKLNALDRAMFEALIEAGERLRRSRVCARSSCTAPGAASARGSTRRASPRWRRAGAKAPSPISSPAPMASPTPRSRRRWYGATCRFR